MKTFAITLLLLTLSAAFAANEAGWDIQCWDVHFTILFNDWHGHLNGNTIWRGDDVEYRLMKFSTADPTAARDAHIETGHFNVGEITTERDLADEATSKGFASGLETEYYYAGDGGLTRELVWYLSDGEDCYALIFSCNTDEWDDNEFYRDDFFTSVSKY